MSASFQREEELFASALALPVLERARYLERACGGDRELLARVNGLLEKFSDAERRLERPPWLPADARTPRQPGGEEAPGDSVGAYRLLHEIGEGGGGVVYLAEQGAPVRRQVALKIIKLGMDTRAVVARFEAERQTLAMMDHPNIARVFEAGATPSGRPYFVMEMVRGIRITDYCDQGRLSPVERLALFIQTCRAVQHAHQKGIVHRDIKPSNILVTLHDGLPLVKVIDFGIAKAMAGQLGEHTVHTALGQFIGTPAYVSPEQTEPGGAGIDARSDIYSLGVLLYELLTGCTPFDSAELIAAGFARMTHRIREEEPLSPSRRLRTLDEQRMTWTAEHRKMQAARLVRLLHGDLDWIVMRCLEKEPAQRYASVDDLVQDLQRHLRNEPVVVRPRRLLYVFAKFARRHRAVFVTSASVFALLLAATAVSGWLAVRATRAERLAQSESASRQEIINFLQHDLLAQASPSEEPDRDLKLRTVLDRASAKIQDRFPGQPLVEADVRETLARTYDSLGEYANARGHIEVASGIRQRELGEEHPKTLSLMSYLADLLAIEGHYEKAAALCLKTLQVQRRVLGPENLETLESTARLATNYSQQGRFDEAAQLLEQTLHILNRVLGPDKPETLITMNNLAWAYYDLGKFEQALALQEKTYLIGRRVHGPEHPETLNSMSSVASGYNDAGRFADAEALNRQALELSARIRGPTHPATLILMHNLANAYLDLGDFAQAEQLERQALAAMRKALGEDHQDTIKARNTLAMIHHAQGRSAEARKMQEQTLAAGRRVLGPGHPVSIMIASNLAMIDEDLARPQEAESLLRDAVARATAVFGATHPRTLGFIDQHAGALTKLGRYDDALQLLRRSLAARERTAPEHWRTFSARSQLGAVLTGLGRLAEAEQLLMQAHAGLRQRRHTIPARLSALRDSEARIEQLNRARDTTRAAQR